MNLTKNLSHRYINSTATIRRYSKIYALTCVWMHYEILQIDAQVNIYGYLIRTKNTLLRRREGGSEGRREEGREE
jgi:hypothetical protein